MTSPKPTHAPLAAGRARRAAAVEMVPQIKFPWLITFAVLAHKIIPSIPSLPYKQQAIDFSLKNKNVQSPFPKGKMNLLSLQRMKYSIMPLRGGIRPDHLPRSFKRALRRHTKARLQEEQKGRLGRLSRKIAAINSARAAAKAHKLEAAGSQPDNQLALTANEEDEDDSVSSSSEAEGRGGWMRTVADDPSDMTVLLQVAVPQNRSRMVRPNSVQTASDLACEATRRCSLPRPPLTPVDAVLVPMPLPQTFEPRTADQLVGPDGTPRPPNWDHSEREMRGVNELNEPM